MIKLIDIDKNIKTVNFDFEFNNEKYDFYKPEIIFYYSYKCPICKRFISVIDELNRKTRIPIDYVVVEFRFDKKISWFKKFCKDEIGGEVVPIVVFWENGFEKGDAEVWMIERNYTGILTPSLEARILILSEKLIKRFEKYNYDFIFNDVFEVI